MKPGRDQTPAPRLHSQPSGATRWPCRTTGLL